MELAGEKLHKQTGNCQSYRCVAHRLQLCIEEGLHIFSQALGTANEVGNSLLTQCSCYCRAQKTARNNVY